MNRCVTSFSGGLRQGSHWIAFMKATQNFPLVRWRCTGPTIVVFLLTLKFRLTCSRGILMPSAIANPCFFCSFLIFLVEVALFSNLCLLVYFLILIATVNYQLQLQRFAFFYKIHSHLFCHLFCQNRKTKRYGSLHWSFNRAIYPFKRF